MIRMVSWMPPRPAWWKKASWVNDVEEEEAVEEAVRGCRAV